MIVQMFKNYAIANKTKTTCCFTGRFENERKDVVIQSNAEKHTDFIQAIICNHIHNTLISQARETNEDIHIYGN